MIEVVYTDEFVRKYATLPKDLQVEVKEKVELVRNRAHHKQLKVHKLHGPLLGYYSFSVNYRYRIVFSYAEGKKVLVLRTVGDHSVYK